MNRDDECSALGDGLPLVDPVVAGEVVLRHLEGLARFQRAHVLHQQIGFE